MSVHDFRWLDEAAKQGPTPVRLKAIDIVPYRYGVWCAVEDGEPFANEVVVRSWAEDGEHIWFMLETHNTLKARADEEIEVVELPPDKYVTPERRAEREERDRRRMAMRPGRAEHERTGQEPV